MSVARTTQRNLCELMTQGYLGRGLVVGLDERAANWIQLYWLTGRSENSQSRIFSSKGERLFTEPTDPTKVPDPRLVIYDAMARNGGHCVVSNGHQTLPVTTALADGQTLEQALASWQYEPDAPNNTPRITGVFSFDQSRPVIELAILHRSPTSTTCERSFYPYGFSEIPQGTGYGITTYSGDGNPLPSFRGPPILLPLKGSIEAIARSYWDGLDTQTRVALAVKSISRQSGASTIRIINRFKKV